MMDIKEEKSHRTFQLRIKLQSEQEKNDESFNFPSARCYCISWIC